MKKSIFVYLIGFLILIGGNYLFLKILGLNLENLLYVCYLTFANLVSFLIIILGMGIEEDEKC